MTKINPVILTWEYPPRIIGDLAHHVGRLTQGLNKAKIPTSVVTCHNAPYSYERRSDLLELFWASNPVEPHISVITWCLTLNSEIERVVSDIYYGRNKKIDILVITGIMTHLCCETTARDAFMRDYEIYFVIDSTASYNETLHVSSLMTLTNGFAIPVKTDTILKEVQNFE